MKPDDDPFAEADRNAARTAAGAPPIYDEPPQTTIEGARLAARSGDVARLKRYLDGRPPREILAIATKLEGAALPPATQEHLRLERQRLAKHADGRKRKAPRPAPIEPTVIAEDDARGLAEVMADSDWRMACAFASSTDSPPELWFGMLREGVPFHELQVRARDHVRKRIEHFRALKQQQQLGRRS